MARKMISIRLEPDLIEHVKNQAVKKDKEFTEYVQDALVKESNYKKKEEEVFDLLIQDKDDACSLPHLKIQHNLGLHEVIPKKDNDFDIEF